MYLKKGKNFINQHKIWMIFIFILLPLHSLSEAGACKIIVPEKIQQGNPLIVEVNAPHKTPEGSFNGKKLYFIRRFEQNYMALTGVDLEFEPGQYPIHIKCNHKVIKKELKVIETSYKVQRLTLPKDKVELSPENEERAEKEASKFEKLWPIETSAKWQGSFIMPLKGGISSPFGVKRFINGQKKSPHSGIDIRGGMGAPVIAPNKGEIVLIDDQFFGGKTLVVDHGHGIYSTFFHLSKIEVLQGQEVKKGDLIARVGSTGRSTGPHLHWGVRIQGSRVDPVSIVSLKLD